MGTKGTLAIGHIRQTPIVMMTRSGRTHDLIAHWLERFAEAYRREMCGFVEAVLRSLPPRVTGHDGRQSLAVAEAAVQSFRGRKPVRVQLARVPSSEAAAAHAASTCWWGASRTSRRSS